MYSITITLHLELAIAITGGYVIDYDYRLPNPDTPLYTAGVWGWIRQQNYIKVLKQGIARGNIEVLRIYKTDR